MGKHIGIITAGGDSPGLNAAIRGIGKTALGIYNMQVTGVMDGFRGLMENRTMRMSSEKLSGILTLGGTILGTSRDKPNKMQVGGKQMDMTEVIVENYYRLHLDALVCIGGGGTQKNAFHLMQQGLNIVTLPKTIDNDVYGTEETIGFDSAVNTAIVEIDKIRDTANSHERIFIVEVMGRKRGFLALTIGLTVGAEVILVPEVEYPLDQIVRTLEKNASKGKKSGIIVAAEGIGDTHKLMREIEKEAGVEVRLSVTGYAQRGGNPTARSRLLANLFGDKAVELLMNKQGSRMVALQEGKITSIKLEQVCSKEKPLDLSLMKLAETLAT